MKKVLLLALNARFTHSNLALHCLRTSAVNTNYEISIKELTINQQSLEIITEIYQNSPDVLAISVYIWNSQIVQKILPEIKKVLPKCKIVLGGPEVSYNSEDWIKNFPEIDFIIRGHGETGFKFLLENNLTSNMKIIHIQNPHFNEIDFPYCNDDFTELAGKYLYYESSRGCSFRCSYCLSSRSDQKLEYRSLEKVKTELTYLISKKPKIVKFVDRTFNANKVFAREVWQFLIDFDTDTKFHFEIFPGLLEEQDFAILSAAPEDRFQFEIGIQSVNPHVVKTIDRNDNWLISKDNIKKLIDLKNIHIHTDMIVGLPSENFSELQHSFNEIYALKSDHFQLGFLKVIPGTKIREQADKFNIKYTHTPPYHVLSTSEITFDELSDIKNIELLLNKYYNSGKYLSVTDFLCSFYDVPYDFYNVLRRYYEENEIDIANPNWQQNAKIFIEFGKQNHPELVQQIRDRLRWDWCKTANSHYFPDFLQNDKLKQAKELGYRFLKNLSEQDTIIFDEHSFKLSALKSAVFFLPESAEFSSEFDLENKIAVFIKESGKKVVLRIPMEKIVP